MHAPVCTPATMTATGVATMAGRALAMADCEEAVKFCVRTIQ